MVWALAVVLFRRSGESMPPCELNLSKNILAASLMLPTIVLWHGLALPQFTAQEVLVLLVSGLLGIALGDTLYFRALNLLGAGRTGIVSSLLSPFVIVLSALFLGERLAPWQWAGFVLVMAGILLVTWRRQRREVDSEDLRRGVLLGVAAIMAMAVGVVMVKGILETRPFMWVAQARLLGGLAGMLLLVTLRGHWGRVMHTYRQPHRWGITLWAGGLGGYFSMMLWLAGYKLISASEASIYNEAQGAFIVLFAWLILGEPIGLRKLAGLGLTLAGVLVMLLT
jgi:drug/metabolite transporter (DMT)-like permease